MRKTIPALTCVLLLAATSTASATGVLLVRSFSGNDWDLYMINEDGTGLQAVDISPTNVSHGDFSPDGKTILYCAETSPGSVSIFQVPARGGTPKVVPGGGNVSVYRPCWGNSTDSYFYGGVVGGSCGNYDIEMHRVTCTLDAEGLLDEFLSDEIILSTKNVQLYDVDEDHNKMSCRDVSPAVCSSSASVLVTYDADGTNRNVLTSTIDGKAESFTTISPDGEYILYFKSDSGTGNPHNIYRIGYDGSGQQPLTTYTGDIMAAYPIWRDNDSVFYSVGPTRSSINHEIHKYTISTGADVVVPCDLPNCAAVAYTPIPLNSPPLADAGPDQTVDQESYNGTEVTLDGSNSTDPDSSPGTNDDIVSFDWYEGTTLLGSGETIDYIFQLGEHTVILVVTDSGGKTDDDEVIIIVEDTTPPTIYDVSASPDVLWPPNHRMVEVTVEVNAEDICDPEPFCWIIGVTSNEPVNGQGDGNTEPDWEYTDDPLVVLLRAERSGGGDGRVYTIHVVCEDASGNTTYADVEVTVPHNKGKGKGKGKNK